jgi:O-antigen/teichoic acid export membrane protein
MNGYNLILKQLQRTADWFKDDVFRRLFLNAGKLLSAKGIAVLFGLISTIITARALGPDNYGILALVIVYEATVGKLVSFNAWQAIIKFGSEAQQSGRISDLRQLIKFGFSLDIGSAIIGTLLAVALSGPVIALLGWQQDIQHLLALYSILILFSLSGTPIGILRLFDRFDLLSYTAVISALVKLAGVVWCYITTQNLLGFVIVYLITGIVGELYQLFAALWTLKRQGLGNFATTPLNDLRERFPGIVDYVWTTNLNSTVRMFSRQFDELIIAGLTTPAALGLFKIAKQFSQLLPMLIDPLYQSIYPELARLWAANNRIAFCSLIKRSTALIGSAAIGSWLLFIIAGEQIISWTVGAMYQEAYWLAVWYMLALVIAMITFSLQPSMLALGLPKESFKIQIAATAVYLVILIPLVGWWLGIMGAAIGYIIYYLIWSALMLKRLRFHMH